MIVMMFVLTFLTVSFSGCKKSSETQGEDLSAIIGVNMGNTAQNFSEEDFQGNTVALDQYKGKVIFLTFSAMWCGPCRQECPDLNRLNNTYKERGLEIVQCIYQDEDGNPADLQDLARWMNEFGINFMVFRDEDRSTVDAWRFSGIPFNCIIDRNFVIKYRRSGYDGNEIENLIEDLL